MLVRTLARPGDSIEFDGVRVTRLPGRKCRLGFEALPPSFNRDPERSGWEREGGNPETDAGGVEKKDAKSAKEET